MQRQTAHLVADSHAHFGAIPQLLRQPFNRAPAVPRHLQPGAKAIIINDGIQLRLGLRLPENIHAPALRDAASSLEKTSS